MSKKEDPAVENICYTLWKHAVLNPAVMRLMKELEDRKKAHAEERLTPEEEKEMERKTSRYKNADEYIKAIEGESEEKEENNNKNGS